MKKSFLLIALTFYALLTLAQDVIKADKRIYQVIYSQKLQQPLSLFYKETNRQAKVNRGSMDFYTEPGIETSDNNDYARNRYDKGHLAPAASFSDNMENLKLTFSYLNCALQDMDLNRGQWKQLEEAERIWDNSEDLDVEVNCLFSKLSKVLPTGATIPDAFQKHIYFTKQRIWKCYQFPNHTLQGAWELYHIKCIRHLN